MLVKATKTLEELDLSYNAQGFLGSGFDIRGGRASRFYAVADEEVQVTKLNVHAHSSRTQMILSGPAHPEEDIDKILDARFVSGKQKILDEKIAQQEAALLKKAAGRAGEELTSGDNEKENALAATVVDSEPTTSAEERTRPGAGGGNKKNSNSSGDVYSPLSLFCEGLAENDTLQTLDLAHSGVDAKTAFVLETALIGRCPGPTRTPSDRKLPKLRALFLAGSPLGAWGLESLLRLIVAIPTLRCVDVSGFQDASPTIFRSSNLVHGVYDLNLRDPFARSLFCRRLVNVVNSSSTPAASTCEPRVKQLPDDPLPVVPEGEDHQGGKVPNKQAGNYKKPVGGTSTGGLLSAARETEVFIREADPAMLLACLKNVSATAGSSTEVVERNVRLQVEPPDFLRQIVDFSSDHNLISSGLGGFPETSASPVFQRYLCFVKKLHLLTFSQFLVMKDMLDLSLPTGFRPFLTALRMKAKALLLST
eukprot:g20437.t1